MRQFNRESKFGGRENRGSRDRPFERRESGGREGRGSRDRPFEKRGGERSSFGRKPLEMTKIVCDKCGKESEVPFKPSSDKPVYCLECFRNKDSDSRPSYSDRPAARTEFAKPDNLKRELAQINEKLDKIMKALEID